MPDFHVVRSFRAKLGPHAGLWPTPPATSRGRARVRARLHRSAGLATVAGEQGTVSAWVVGPELRLVVGDHAEGTLLSFLRRDGSTSELRHEPAWRAVDPPMGVAPEPAVLIVGLLRNVGSIVLADAVLRARRLVVVERDADIAELALSMIPDDVRSKVELHSGTAVIDLLAAIADDRFDLAIVDVTQIDGTGRAGLAALIDAICVLLSPHATLVIRREVSRTGSATGATRPVEAQLAARFASIRHARINRRTAADLWFASILRVEAEPSTSAVPTEPPRQPLSIEIVSSLDALRRLAPEWLELCRTCPATSAYQSPGWIVPWFEYFGGASAVETLAVRRGAELVGVVPMARRSIGGRRGWTRLWSAGTEHGDYGEPPLVGDREEVAARVAGHLAERVRDGRTTVDVRRLVDDGPLAVALSRRDDILIVPIQELSVSAYVRFDIMEDPAAYLAKHSKKNRLPQKLAKLEAEVGSVRFTPHDPDVQGVLRFMDAQMTDRFGADGPKIFSTARRAAFTAVSTARLVDDGLARLSTIRAGDRLLAVEIVHVSGGIHTWDFGAYDVSLARFSLGQMVLYEILRQANLEQATAVDLRAGDFPYKYAWSNAGRVGRSYSMVPLGRVGDVAWLARLGLVSSRHREMAGLDRTNPPAVGVARPAGVESLSPRPIGAARGQAPTS